MGRSFWLDPYIQKTVATVSIYDTAKDTWTSAPAMPDTQDHARAAAVGRNFYVLGGCEQGQLKGKDTVLVLSLDDVGAGWTVIAATIPTPRAGLAAAAVWNRLYTFGGEGNLILSPTYVFNNTEVYHVESGEWEVLSYMKVPRHGTSAVAVGGKVYIPGGGDIIGVAPVDYFDVFIP
jgi:N-acetylneuraminic acid mutarotase